MSKKLSLFLLIITVLGLLHTLLFVLFWLTNSLYYAEVNNFLFDKLGRRLDYILLTQVFSTVMLVWSSVRLVIFRLRRHAPGWSDWLFVILILFYFIFFYGSFWTLFNQSPAQWSRLLFLIGYYRVFVDFIYLVGLTILFKKCEAYVVHKFSGKILRFISPFSTLVIFVFLWSVPLMFPPASVHRTPLPPKPYIIAHRGASMLRPENTLAAARQALALGADGLEADIRISLDGIPFLMHDYGLERTTDVALRFPDRKEDLPESFTLAELKQLNAGEWFYQEDPYHTIADGLVSEGDAQALRQERIPSLAEELDFLKGNELIFIFDLIDPPEGHPYHDQFFEICFNMIHQAGLDSRIWFLAKGERREMVAASAPGMVLTYGADYRRPPEASELTQQGYQIVNVEYGLPVERIQKYQQAGLKVNLYVVDEPWMFSKMWLAGADSMTTDNVHTMVSLDKPLLDIPYSSYFTAYSLFGIVTLAITLLSKI